MEPDDSRAAREDASAPDPAPSPVRKRLSPEELEQRLAKCSRRSQLGESPHGSPRHPRTS